MFHTGSCRPLGDHIPDKMSDGVSDSGRIRYEKIPELILNNMTSSFEVAG